MLVAYCCVFTTAKFVLRCNILTLNDPYFENPYNVRQRFLCPCAAYRSKAVFSTQFSSSNVHEYVVRYLSVQRKLTYFYLEFESLIRVVVVVCLLFSLVGCCCRLCLYIFLNCLKCYWSGFHWKNGLRGEFHFLFTIFEIP